MKCANKVTHLRHFNAASLPVLVTMPTSRCRNKSEVESKDGPQAKTAILCKFSDKILPRCTKSSMSTDRGRAASGVHTHLKWKRPAEASIGTTARQYIEGDDIAAGLHNTIHPSLPAALVCAIKTEQGQRSLFAPEKKVSNADAE